MPWFGRRTPEKGRYGTSPVSHLTKIDARVLAELSFRDLVAAIWLPTVELRREREISRWRLHLVWHRCAAEEPRSLDADHVRPPALGV
jgi:hypothetical protein